MTDQKRSEAIRNRLKAIRHFPKTAGQAIRHRSDPKPIRKPIRNRSESGGMPDQNSITAGQAISKFITVSDRPPIRKPGPLYIWGPGFDRPPGVVL